MELRKFGFAAVLAAVLATVGTASASILYDAGNVDFSNVKQSSAGTTGAPTDPYGTPQTALNALVFNPGQFHVNAPSPGLAFLDGTLTMTVTAHRGSHIDQLGIEEAGDYTLLGNGTAATLVNLGAPIFVTIIGMDGQPITPIRMDGSVAFTGDNGATGDQFNLIDNGGIGVHWNGLGTIDFSQLSGHVTKLLLAVNNDLFANAESDSVALVAKKRFLVTAGTSDVPEPGTLTLIALGVGLLMIRRRKRALA